VTFDPQGATLADMAPARRESGGTVRKRPPRFPLARGGRGIAVVVASASVIALTALSVGGVAAIADPSTTTAPTPTTPTSTMTSEPSASTSESPETTPSSPVSSPEKLPAIRRALMLSSQQGTPRTQVTITAAGYGPCLHPGESGFVHPVFSLQWGAASVDLSHARTTNGDRDVVVDYTVPDDAPAADYTVTASCGDTSDTATFTVVAPKKEPTLKLDTTTGHRGSKIMASGTDFACGSSETVQLLWDGKGDPLAEAQPPTFTIPLTVPDETSIGGHTVVAQCQYHSTINAGQPFEVTKTEPPVVTPPPTLGVQPTSGHPGDKMRITGERFVCTDHAATVELRWDDGTQLATPPVDASGHFDTSVPVPSNADARGHTVRAACADESVAMVTTFTVVAKGSPPPPVRKLAAAMALQPASGQRGDEMRIAGERFACANRTVALSWDDGTRLANPPVDASGGFAASVPVPANADIGSHTVGAACSDGSIALAAAFTVIAAPLSPPPPPPVIWGWVIALILVVAAVLVVRHIRHRRHPRLFTRVQVVTRPGGPPVATVHETPAHGEATHAIRLEAHFDSGIQTISEVNDGYTRT